MALQDKPGGWRAHTTAEIAESAVVGAGTVLWRNVHVREDASVGGGCNIGAGVYVGAGVRIGDRCKVQNDALLYEGLTLGDGVFIGPQVCFTNDYWPRAINPDGTLKTAIDWDLGRTVVEYGASVGARSVIIPGVRIGAFAMIGAGSVVTRDVPRHALVYGSPSRHAGWVCRCGRRLAGAPTASVGWCSACEAWTQLPEEGLQSQAVARSQLELAVQPATRLARRRTLDARARDVAMARARLAMRCRGIDRLDYLVDQDG